MSVKNKIRDLKTDRGEFEIYLIEPEGSDEFKLPYVLAIPRKLKNGKKLIVETNNRERDNQERDLDYRSKRGKEFLIENAINEVLGIKCRGKIEYAKNVGAPILMPIIPAVDKGIPYYQQLSREALIQNNPSSDFYRIDEQVCKMIEDARKMISERGVKIEEKIFLNGSSSSGVFAQRFAFLHPEIVDTALIGGAGETIPMPSDCKGSDELEYPLGTKDYKEITGREFDSEAYKKINFQYYLAEFEEMDKSKSRKNEFGLRAPSHDMAYMDRSVPINTGKRFRELFGINLWKRFANQIAEYEKSGYKIKAEIYRRKFHASFTIPEDEFEAIYEGKEFPKTSEDIKRNRGRKILDTIGLGLKRIRQRFTKKLSPSGKDINEEYSKKVESIDDIELGKKIEQLIKSRGLDEKIETLRKKYQARLKERDGISEQPLQTKLTEEQVVELTQKFFESVDLNIAQKAKDIMSRKTTNVNGQFIDLQMYPYDENLRYYFTKYDTNSRGYGIRNDKAVVEMQNSNDLVICVPLKGHLGDLYSLVHEITHSFDTKNGDPVTRKILGEIAPQCMERMLDDFLIGLPTEEKQKYGIEESKLLQDIQDKKITTFISRYDNTMNFNRNRHGRMINARYMLAQLYQTQLIKYSPQERKQRILEFMSKIEQDDFEGANRTFGMQIDRNNSLSRDMYIMDMIEEFASIINLQEGDALMPEKFKQQVIEKDLEK